MDTSSELIAAGSTLAESLALAPALDGRLGSNRGRGGVCQLGADTDIDAVRCWLAEYAGSPHTLRAYRKEAERLLVWTTRALGKPLSSLAREDLLAYEAFLARPGNDWIDGKLPRRGGGRRLFDGPLSPQSVRHALGILSGLFVYLVAAGYLAGNPLALRRQHKTKSLSRRAAIERYLDQELWRFVLDFVERMPQSTARERQHFERARWLLRLLHGAGLRAAEAAQARAGDLGQRRGKWWLHVVGKGGVEGDVPVSDEMMGDFARYRASHGLGPLPGPNETTPLIMSLGGNREHCLTSTAIYLAVKDVFVMAADTRSGDDPVGADKLRRASTHWVRHSAATHQADAGNDLRFIQKNLRHASLETTAIYLHADDDRRHAATTGPELVARFWDVAQSGNSCSSNAIGEADELR
ncbi:tyrosine-type recombinase/integrase [Xanthomonas hortorum]|uniref:tyrosine-type recombinase/integrase n=1 Tax=Xanthomonas hortorum TaxID=56454 RepID=UPI0032E8CF1C